MGGTNEYVPDSQNVEIIKIIKQESKNPAGSNQTSDKPIPYAPWYWYIYLHDWVIFFGQILGFIFQHHVSHVTKINPATIGFSHDSPKIHQ
jgi:hypothetical protein